MWPCLDFFIIDDCKAKWGVHITINTSMLVCLYFPVICSKGNTSKMSAESLFACQGRDFTEKTRTSKIRGAELLAKNLLDSLILKDISMAYTPLSLPTFIWAHPAPLYRSRLQRASSNSNSAAYKIGNHVSLRRSGEWRSLGKKLETFREIVYFSFFFLFFLGITLKVERVWGPLERKLAF